jgi:hypothetical protein
VRHSGSLSTPSPSVSETPCLAMFSASLPGSNSMPMPEYMHDVHIRQTSRRGQGWRLTVKLRGRATAPAKHRGRTLSTGARGAKPLTPHGPLQRLLEAMQVSPSIATSSRPPGSSRLEERPYLPGPFQRAIEL